MNKEAYGIVIAAIERTYPYRLGLAEDIVRSLQEANLLTSEDVHAL